MKSPKKARKVSAFHSTLYSLNICNRIRLANFVAITSFHNMAFILTLHRKSRSESPGYPEIEERLEPVRSSGFDI
jgi:hypothetical protein